MDIGLTGVVTPTATTSGMFDDLAAKGYVGVRVPHMPPAYTASSLIGGIGNSPAVEFSYWPVTKTIPMTEPSAAATHDRAGHGGTSRRSGIDRQQPLADHGWTFTLGSVVAPAGRSVPHSRSAV
jgi:hypothetical protein